MKWYITRKITVKERYIPALLADRMQHNEPTTWVTDSNLIIKLMKSLLYIHIPKQ